MKKILIIEDDPLITNIYRHKFEGAGYEVANAADGESGLQKLKDFRPDLLQLDLMLPRMNGIEVIRRIRSQPEFQRLPILVFSNSYATDMIAEARKAGASRCVSKSQCSPKGVLDLVNELLSSPPLSLDSAVHSGSQTLPPLSRSFPPEPRPLPDSHSAAPRPETGPSMFQLDVREQFLKNGPRILSDLRTRLSLFIRSRQGKEHLSHLTSLARSIHSLAGFAGLSGFVRISQIASALEVLLKDLHNKPDQISSSTFRTVAHAVDCIGLLFEEDSSPQDEIMKTPLILGVDDEPVSRITLRTALDKANLRAITLDDPVLAFKVLGQNRFDLIFLDVDMPGLKGFDLCRKIRASATNKTKPLVFVTVLSEFENRSRSAESGGTEWIGKPLLLAELAVKALSLIVKSTLTRKSGPLPRPLTDDSRPRPARGEKTRSETDGGSKAGFSGHTTAP